MKARILPSLPVTALAFTIAHAAPPDPGFVAHEWGTFTSVQGGDGVQMSWNPLVAPELPKFVFDRSRSRVRTQIPSVLSASKTAITCTQRLETPVIYFYSHESRTVDVSVYFPQGSATEWYPLASAADTSFLPPMQTASGPVKPVLHWGKVQLLGESPAKGVILPGEKSGSHYYAARETDSTPLRVLNEKNLPETEKFLFYRGVGSFRAPLTVTLASTDSRRVTLTNDGVEVLQSLFVYEVRGYGGGAWIKAGPLAPGESCAVAIPQDSTDISLSTLPERLRSALVQEGLYEREAAAMVKTWESSWFSEKGLRVLYTLPRPWTDQTLPLQITPAPRETARVMVGRAEIITPEMEQALLSETARYVAATPVARPAIVAETRALGLGRFMEPTLRRVMTSAKRSSQFSSLSWELLQAVTFPPKTEAAPTAAN